MGLGTRLPGYEAAWVRGYLLTTNVIAKPELLLNSPLSGTLSAIIGASVAVVVLLVLILITVIVIITTCNVRQKRRARGKNIMVSSCVRL